jgi:phosphatidylglycerol:prolipoprotein diacylglycerol transferase
MIPYFQFTVIPIGPLVIQAWGLMVAMGILSGILFTYKVGKKYQLSSDFIFDLALWSILGGILGARFFHVVFYDFSFYRSNPGEIVAFWHGGMSSLGGFVGAALTILLFVLKKKLSLKNFLPYLDIGALGLWLGWGIGRIGCFLIHDHPGTLSNFVMAVKYPGGARHDLGLYDSLLGFGIFFLFFILYKTKIIKIGSGMLIRWSVFMYAVVRFFLDFLRIQNVAGSDVRYFHLTPAQWGMLAVVIGLIIVEINGRLRSRKNV